MRDAIAAGLLTSSHDLSDGGLAVALAESTFRHGVGVTVALDDPFLDLFSESSLPGFELFHGWGLSSVKCRGRFDG